MRRAKVDTTHAEVRDTLRKCGWIVQDVHALPNWCDLEAYQPSTGRHVLIEVKGPKGRERTSQARLKAQGWPVVTVRSAEEAAKL